MTTGTTYTLSRKAEKMAAVLVMARGRNSLPSEDDRNNTGRNATMVVITLVRIAPATCPVPVITELSRSSSGCSRIRRFTLSNTMMPVSTMVPMAMAMPPRERMLASTRRIFMKMKVNNTPAGRIRLMITLPRMLMIRKRITIEVTRISSRRAVFRVPMVSWIRVVRS